MCVRACWGGESWGLEGRREKVKKNAGANTMNLKETTSPHRNPTPLHPTPPPTAQHSASQHSTVQRVCVCVSARVCESALVCGGWCVCVSRVDACVCVRVFVCVANSEKSGRGGPLGLAWLPNNCPTQVAIDGCTSHVQQQRMCIDLMLQTTPEHQLDMNS